MEYRIKAIDESTWQIEEYNENAGVYMYLLAGKKKAILIDTGFGTIDLKKIVQSLTSLPVEVILTHGHADHIGGTSFFERVYLNEKDRQVYQQHSAVKYRKSMTGEDSFAPVKAECTYIKGTEKMDLGDRILKLIPTPGHTIGTICLLDVEKKRMYTGDTCCEANVLLNLDYATDIQTYRNSILRLKQENFTITWPAHHKTPVMPDILDEFEEAATLLLEGKAKGETIDLGGEFGQAMLFSWKRVGIVYKE